MLINASRQREIADAVNTAKADKAYLETVEMCDKAIPMVRKRFEEGVSNAAIRGGTCFRCLLGVEGGQYGSSGMLAEILDELSYEPGKHNMWFDWKRAIEHRSDSKRGLYIWDRWDAMCMDLMEDLESNGYSVKVEKKSHYLSPEYESERTDPVSEVLADHYIKVTW